MTLILCLDDRNGMAFNGRRQSMDAGLRLRILQQVGNRNLWMSTYSAKQFEPLPFNVLADDDFLNKAEGDNACFAEVQVPSACWHKCRKLIVYRWNRVYPADVYFPFSEMEDRLTLISKEDFTGNSHERITEEVYEIK